MTRTDDFEELARRFLDLWQRQLAAQAGDEKIAEDAERAYGLWMQSVKSLAGTYSQMMGSDNDESSAQWPQAASLASGNGDADLGELERRIERLEERLAALEKRDRKKRRGAKKTD